MIDLDHLGKKKIFTIIALNFSLYLKISLMKEISKQAFAQIIVIINMNHPNCIWLQ